MRGTRGSDANEEFKELLGEYYARVVAYLVRKFQFTLDEARDLTQDVFLSVYRHALERPITAPWLFLKTTAHNRAVNAIRNRSVSRRSGREEPLAVLAPEELIYDAPSPEDNARISEETKRLQAAVAKLPPALRSCLQAHLSGQSYDEIAKSLNISLDAARTRIRDGKRLVIANLSRSRR